ncbi:hypothetical protein MNBD_GAMMA11-2776 [hydrothermal vent metagenome]|uniref:Uncharacterized protein n=1 Tax=hydrothermal vent metagenome TaxID=652676 RepID=A0A3B0X010_9ZZZZ
MIRCCFFISLLLLSSTSQCVGQSGKLDGSDRLRTFFTSSHLRNQLDQLRNRGKYTNTNNNSSKTLRKPLKVKMQGVVLRKKKKPVIFINDENTLKSPVINNEIIIDSAATRRKNYKIPVRVNQKTISLKPGQQWDESKKEVEDTYKIPTKKKPASTPDNSPAAADLSTN